MTPLPALRAANLRLRFLLELCLLAALGYWAIQSGATTAAKIGLGLGAPLLTAIVWELFLLPRATVPLLSRARLAVEIVLFGLAVAGLLATGHPVLA